MYLVKSSIILKRLYPSSFIWKISEDVKPTVYITFDDGPHPIATPFALMQLAEYDAKATFFCIGKNVVEYPNIYADILKGGHSVGNHTHNHFNGWKWSTKEYIANVRLAETYINTKLFRPPYGRLKRAQAKRIEEMGYRIFMWDVLSADFDIDIAPEKCWEYVVSNLRPGSILVFHDSAKAFDRMSYALPRTLAFCKEMGWDVKGI
jgi:peptidoglycan/xylan/chitin deacetylase (PgdA/CDA1 family)